MVATITALAPATARENDAVPAGFKVGQDFHDIFGVAPKNVFMVKFAYWLNY